MGLNVELNNKGMTLIEILISMVLLLIASLAMLQTGILSMHTNVVNTLRDEAGSVAEAQMNETRNIPFASLIDTGPTGEQLPSVVRRHRGGSESYVVRRVVRDIAADAKQVTITVDWAYKGRAFNHSITTIIRRRA